MDVTSTHLHNVHHLVQSWHPHVPPAEVVDTNVGSHEGLWIIAETTGRQDAPATMCMLSYFLQASIKYQQRATITAAADPECLTYRIAQGPTVIA